MRQATKESELQYCKKLRELLHSSEDVKKVAAAIKFILQYSQNAEDKETVLETFFNIATLQ
ncbi:hypothetical protein QM565_03695, partial [Geitlerinema splendidum]|nr:hypothetical protein [Geitlerinema splendidum]